MELEKVWAAMDGCQELHQLPGFQYDRDFFGSWRKYFQVQHPREHASSAQPPQ
jgi:hypothetical protein